jgi:MFS transporter, ACS family, allantoate permease
MLLCYCVCIVLAGIYGLVCKWENAQRDKTMNSGEGEWTGDEHADDFLDLTDKQNVSFRYIT